MAPASVCVVFVPVLITMPLPLMTPAWLPLPAAMVRLPEPSVTLPPLAPPPESEPKV